MDTGDDASVTLTFGGLDFTKAGQAFTIDIKNVRAREEGGAVEFTTRISGEVVPVVELIDGCWLTLMPWQQAPNSISRIRRMVTLNLKSHQHQADVTDSTFASFHAGQEVDTIVFTFGAVNTAIKDGQVRFTLPSGWTAMKAPSVDAVP